MGFKIEKTDQYWKCLEEAYDPELPTKRAKELLEGFLYYKSKTVGAGTPKKAEDVIVHLQSMLGKSGNESSKSPLTIFLEHPIISAFVAGIFILVVWQYLVPYFG